MNPVAVEATPKDTAKQEKVAKVLQVPALILLLIYIALMPGCWLGIPCAVAGYLFGGQVRITKLCVTPISMCKYV